MNMTGEHIRLPLASLSLICFLALVEVTSAQDVTITNLTQLVDVAFSANHSLYLPWTPWEIQAYPTDGGEPWWVDCSRVTCGDLLSTSTNSCATLQIHGITVTFATLTKNILTGETLLYSGCSTDVIASIEAQSGYEPGMQLGENVWVWREWQQVTNCLDCWGLSADKIPPPIVTLKTRLADASTYSIYQSNVEADAEAAAAAWASSASSFSAGGGMMFMAMDDDISCTITDEASAFFITDIERETDGDTTVMWTSCSDHIYGVFSSSDLSNWMGIAAMWGDDLSTTWEDTNTAGGVTSQFYKIVRIPPDEGFNGDAIPSGWAVDNGLNPVDPNLDIEDPDNDFWSNLAEYQNGTSPTNSADSPLFSFTINGGTGVVSTTSLHIDLPSGMIADYIVISEDILFSNCVTNAFSWSFDYTLTNDVDGLHTVFLKLMKADGTTRTALAPIWWTAKWVHES